MIDNSLLTTNYVGRDGFVWWIGKVADAKHWKNKATDLEEGWAYRCKVRIIGHHPFDEAELPDEDLPWAHVMVDATSGSGQSCYGESSRMVGGETVFGFFMDGEDAQQPVVFGALARSVNKTNSPTNVLQLSTEGQKAESGAFGTTTGRNAGSYGATTKPVTKVKPSATPTGNADQKAGEDGDTGEKEGLRRQVKADVLFGNITADPHTASNGCEDDSISTITHTIGSFIKTINSLTEFAGTYIDAAQNFVADLGRLIGKATRLIMGAIKNIIRRLRDKVMKYLGKIFRNLIGLIVPEPQKNPIIQAFKRIMDLIFCLFEKAGFDIMDFLKGLLKDLIGKTINASVCAIEQAISAIMGKLLSSISSLLKPILDGLDWLSGMLNNVSSLFNKITSYMNMILSFLECDSLRCEEYDDWTQGMGLSTKGAGKMSNVLNNLDFINNLDYAAGDGSLSFLSLISGREWDPDAPDLAQFFDCTEKTNNPKTQDDLGNSIPSGFLFPKCVPPKVEVFGDCTKKAELIPVVSAINGSILTIVIAQPGLGYEESPGISIIDKTNHGGGAIARTVIDDKGRVVQVYMLRGGSGYCQTNGIIPPKFPVTEEPLDDQSPYITFTTPSDNAVGVQTSVSLSVTFNEPIIRGKGDLVIVESATNATHETIPVEDSRISFLSSSIIKIDPSVDLKHNTEYHLTITSGAFEDLSGNIFAGIARTDTYNWTTRGVAGIGSEPVGIVTDIVTERPGIGYTSGDTGQVGNCSFDLVTTPAGSIVGVKNIRCSDKHQTIPNVVVNTTTGSGAELLPVISYSPDFVQDIGEKPNQYDENGNRIYRPDGRALVIDVIDCVGKEVIRE
tara:strand:- start:1102 stop:3636 length:2535 start_codon:yes stop_codon:yes gene_type:complete